MATGNVVKVWHDGVTAFIAVSVDEGNKRGNVEYIASVPLSDLVGTNAQKKAQLLAAVKAVRDTQLAPTPTDISALVSGIVTL